jgi:lysyl-tRNA synthetase class 1
MLWCDEIAQSVLNAGPQTVNDSKTPSGRVHVGALRGVIMHDAVHKALQHKNIQSRYLYGVDDYDPVDELPAGQGEHFAQYLGQPLCNVPPPPGSSAPDMATHFISEFFDVFKELNVHPTVYRMRDVYRTGQFDAAIEQILAKADVVRKVYFEVSGSKQGPTWYPFQVICENCGRIGTTEVTAFDGKEVTYACLPNKVKWARGCGHTGKVSPFGGRGKLPWKLEWTAKWKSFPVTIEGAGKDHSTRGGSRDVSEACFRAIFGGNPPLNIPYEFFLVDKGKMSSSRGVGASARDMANLLPPEILRFLMLRTKPARTVDFSPAHDKITKNFAEYDRYHEKVHDGTATEDERRTYELSQVGHSNAKYLADFDLVLTLVQMPHIDLYAEIVKRAGRPLTLDEEAILEQRIRSARTWLENYAKREEKLIIHDTLPEIAQTLTNAQRAFLHLLADNLKSTPRDADATQAAIFDAARLTPIPQRDAFVAIYRALLGRDSGPKAGNLLAYLEPDFLQRRLRELPYDEGAYHQETAITPEAYNQFLQKEQPNIATVEDKQTHYLITLKNGQRHLKRIATDTAPAPR